MVSSRMVHVINSKLVLNISNESNVLHYIDCDLRMFTMSLFPKSTSNIYHIITVTSMVPKRNNWRERERERKRRERKRKCKL